MGVLFSLYDWKFEILALLRHVEHLEASFGVGPHTISMPRIEPTVGSLVATNPPHPVSDSDFLKIIAILRMAVPYTGIIMSTREDAQVRRSTLALGVSQISAGSRTNPGGYTDGVQDIGAQFELGDHRPLDEVVRDLASLGYLPSFCTACYRLGRTGRDFMAVAKPGAIKFRCDPNALSTFLEYLIDYASPETRLAGEKLVTAQLDRMGERERVKALKMLAQVATGGRDVYV
jgi:2-iminoacetate synthase